MTRADDFRQMAEEWAESHKRRRADLADLLSDFKEARQERKEARQEMAADLADLLSDFKEARQEMAAGIQRRRAKVVAPPEVEVKPPPAPPEVDDLKEIRGIGRGMEERLNRAGIFTYAQLAEADPEKLAEITGRGLETIRDSWIPRARELAGME